MMFTNDQVNELIKNTFSGWTTMNEVNGYKFFSKTNLSKYIFLPAAGYWRNTTLDGAGSLGLYYTIQSSSQYPWNMQFGVNTQVTTIYGGFPSDAHSVRGVQ